MENFTFQLETQQSAKEVFELLLDINKWWYGVYNETITGKSEKLNDQFSFSAGGGAHHTKQKLIELIPSKKIVWEVTESHLSFLNNPAEWNGTHLEFDILETGKGKTKVTFTHRGLTPGIECYSECSSGWTKYLNNLQNKLK